MVRLSLSPSCPVAVATLEATSFIDGGGASLVKSGQAIPHENNLNTWMVLLAALTLASTTALVFVGRRCIALGRRVAQLSAELEGAHGQLDSLTHAISGDLQAPLRELNRIGRQALQFESVDMEALARQGVDDLRPRYAAATSTIGELPPVKGHGPLLYIALRNLVDNALKFSASAQAPQIEIGGRVHDRDVEYWVRDNGTGFDMSNRHRLFEIFQRLHTADEFAGVGTGLAMVRLIVERHGGSAHAQGKPGEGATFTLLLPRPR